MAADDPSKLASRPRRDTPAPIAAPAGIPYAPKVTTTATSASAVPTVTDEGPPAADAGDSTVSFFLELARAMHEFGTPAHQLETALATVARRLGLIAEVFSTPTSLMIGLGPLERQRVHLLRVEPASPNLGNLARLNAVVRAVRAGRISPAAGLTRLHTLRAHAPHWPTGLVLAAYALSSAAVATFLHVDVRSMVIAAMLGLLTGTIALAAGSAPGWRAVTEPLAGFVISTLAFAIDAFTGANAGYLTSLAGLVMLLPGLTFTVALTELSTRNLTSGTSRLTGTLVVFLGLGFGLALGAKFGAVLGAAAVAVLPTLVHTGAMPLPLPGWTEWCGLIIAPLSFAILLNAHRHDIVRILIASIVAYLTSKGAGARMGDELGAFLGAFVVSAGSNIAARRSERSAMVTQVPGLLILVPGSIGFRSVTSLLGAQVEAGVATAFHVAILGISLAAGVLAGNLLVAADAPTAEEPHTP